MKSKVGMPPHQHDLDGLYSNASSASCGTTAICCAISRRDSVSSGRSSSSTRPALGRARAAEQAQQLSLAGSVRTENAGERAVGEVDGDAVHHQRRIRRIGNETLSARSSAHPAIAVPGAG